jgi:hypothetical protein
MNSWEPFLGNYYYRGLLIQVQVINGNLVATVPGVPKGYEIRLEPIGDDLYINRGGPVDGSLAQFIPDSTGKVTAMRVGPFELSRVESDKLKKLPVVSRLLAPKIVFTLQKKEAFEALYQECVAKADGKVVDYQLPFPKYEFIQYVGNRNSIIFHGSNHNGIEVFQPVRKSMELMDETGRGNIAGVYGTHDGLWAMFFAIIDRSKLKGSIHNGVMYFHNQAGQQLAVYNFSINQDQIDNIPVTNGTLYFLPRERFKRLMLTPESAANEWVCEEPVKPIARLPLEPPDFPFLHQIGGHDDGPLIRLEEISQEIRDLAVSASRFDDRFEIYLPPGAIELTILKEYVDLQNIFTPAARFQVEQTNDQVNLSLSSIPPAIRHMLVQSYQELLQEQENGQSPEIH